MSTGDSADTAAPAKVAAPPVVMTCGARPTAAPSAARCRPARGQSPGSGGGKEMRGERVWERGEKNYGALIGLLPSLPGLHSIRTPDNPRRARERPFSDAPPVVFDARKINFGASPTIAVSASIVKSASRPAD